MQKFKQGLELWGLQIRPSGASSYLGSFTHSNTTDRTYTFPDKNGTIAMLSDITASGLPAQAGNAGKLLTTDGNNTSWSNIIVQPLTLSLPSGSIPILNFTRTDLSNTVTLTHTSPNLLTLSSQLAVANDPATALQVATKQYIDNTVTGIQPTSIAACISNWQSFTPIWTASIINPAIGNGTVSGFYRRVGDTLELSISIQFGSTTTYGSGNWIFSLPSGFTADTSKYSSGLLGYARLLNTSGGDHLITDVDLINNTTFGLLYLSSWVGSSNPGAYNANGIIEIRGSIPVSQWTNNINLIKDFTEYISCDGTGAGEGTAANTTYISTNPYRGSNGSLIPAVAITSTTATTQTVYKLTPTQPIKNTDLFILEWSDGINGWVPANSLTHNGVAYGLCFNNVIIGWSIYPDFVNNRINVNFSNAGRIPGAGYGIAAYDWSYPRSLGWRWRIRKISNGNFAQGSPSVSFIIGDGSTLTYTLNHNLGTSDVDVSLWELNSPYRKVDSGISITNPTRSVTSVVVTFTTPPASNSVRATIFSSGGTSSIDTNYREVLIANRTYYVRSDGNDNNNGLSNTSAGAFAKIQTAIDTIANKIDMRSYLVEIQVADSNWAEGLVLKSYVGSTEPTIKGNLTTPSNCIITPPDGTSAIMGRYVPRWHIKGFKLTSSTSTLIVLDGADITIGNMDFGVSTNNQHIWLRRKASCYTTATYTISGSANVHIILDSGSIFENFHNITINNTPTFSHFVRSYGNSLMDNRSGSYSGAAIGGYYYVEGGGVIYSNGSNFPGNTGGGIGPGGVYI